MVSTSVQSLDAVLDKYIPEDELKSVKQLIYGPPTTKGDVPSAAANLAQANDFEVAYHKFDSVPEQMRSSRITKIGLIQNQIILPTTAPVKDQYEAIKKRLDVLIDAAGLMGVNVLCLQEAWTAPFFFCTREKYPWSEFAEDPEFGDSTMFIKQKAKQWNMVIVSPIFERDSVHGETVWNTAVVIGNNGNYIGKHRKNHIPRVGDFNESTYYMEGNTGHPVFETAFGKVAINICYGRHHPMNWQMFALNGAEIIFNPCATVAGLSEPMWFIEGRNAAIANSVFTASNNRIGTEEFPNEFTSANGKPAHKDFGHFYGSSYVASPDGSRCPGLSRTRDGVLCAEVDLNRCRQVKDSWCFQMTNRIELYAKSFTEYCQPDYKPQVIRDPSLARPKADQ